MTWKTHLMKKLVNWILPKLKMFVPWKILNRNEKMTNRLRDNICESQIYRLISRVYKQLSKLNTEKITKFIRKANI